MLPVLEQLARNFSVLLAAAFSSHRRDHNQVSAQLRRQEAASTEVVEAGARGPRCRAHRPLLNAQGNDWVLRRLLIWIKCIFKTKNNLGKKTIKPWLLLEPLFVASGKSSGSHWFLSLSAGFIGRFSVHSWCEARWEGALCLRYHQYQENLTVPCRFFLHLKNSPLSNWPLTERICWFSQSHHQRCFKSDWTVPSMQECIWWVPDWLCFSGIPVESKVNIFINSFGSIQETTMVTYTLFSQSLRWW